MTDLAKWPRTMPKNAFAAALGRGPSAVSNWISTGKLTAEAFEGTGRGARVITAVALRQLDMSLDTGQQLAQARPVSGRTGTADDGEDGRLRSHQQRRAEAMAEMAEIDLRRALREEREQNGQWLQAAEARAEFGRLIAHLLTTTEAHLQTEAPERLVTALVPEDLAAVAATADVPVEQVRAVVRALDISPRRLGVLLRDGYRAHRKREATAMQQEASGLPETVDAPEDGDGTGDHDGPPAMM